MHYAAQAACLPAMTLLLDSGAAIDFQTECGTTPLQIVASANVVDAVDLLLTAGAALYSLHPCWQDLGVAVKAIVQDHVKKSSLAAACSIRAASICSGGAGLSTDVIHCILERVLGADEKFVRLLLGGDLEGCL